MTRTIQVKQSAANLHHKLLAIPHCENLFTSTLSPAYGIVRGTDFKPRSVEHPPAIDCITHGKEISNDTFSTSFLLWKPLSGSLHCAGLLAGVCHARFCPKYPGAHQRRQSHQF